MIVRPLLELKQSELALGSSGLNTPHRSPSAAVKGASAELTKAAC